jgi:hypothetical protein
MFIGLAVTAPEAVAVLLGSKWAAAAPLLQILALVMPLRMVATLLPRRSGDRPSRRQATNVLHHVGTLRRAGWRTTRERPHACSCWCPPVR